MYRSSIAINLLTRIFRIAQKTQMWYVSIIAWKSIKCYYFVSTVTIFSWRNWRNWRDGTDAVLHIAASSAQSENDTAKKWFYTTQEILLNTNVSSQKICIYTVRFVLTLNKDTHLNFCPRHRDCHDCHNDLQTNFRGKSFRSHYIVCHCLEWPVVIQLVWFPRITVPWRYWRETYDKDTI